MSALYDANLKGQVTAEAVLVSADVARESREQIGSIRPSADCMEKATTILQRLGFSVIAEGVISLTISGAKETFEKVFQIKLVEKKQEFLQVQGAQTSYYVPLDIPKIPDELQGLVKYIAFPVPPSFK